MHANTYCGAWGLELHLPVSYPVPGGNVGLRIPALQHSSGTSSISWAVSAVNTSYPLCSHPNSASLYSQQSQQQRCADLEGSVVKQMRQSTHSSLLLEVSIRRRLNLNIQPPLQENKQGRNSSGHETVRMGALGLSFGWCQGRTCKMLHCLNWNVELL